MYDLKVQRFLNLMRLLDAMAAEPVVQLQYLGWRQFPDPVAAMGEFFEDLQGYESLIEEMADDGDFRPEEQELFAHVLSLSESIDADPNSYTRAAVMYGDAWREVRDAAMVLKLSLSALTLRNPGFFASSDGA
ncbi:hypothetical protein ACWD4J_31240 [Streptomyces sp. NPDC002577]